MKLNLYLNLNILFSLLGFGVEQIGDSLSFLCISYSLVFG